MSNEKLVTFKTQIGSAHLLNEALEVTVGKQVFKFEPSADKSYVLFDLFHSYPAVNANNFAITLPMMAKSAGTAIYSPMNKNHKAEGNPRIAFDPDIDNNEIMGAMVMAYIPGIEAYDTIPLIPDEPLPFRVVAVFWKRFEIVQDFLNDVANNISWMTSIEVLRNSQNDMYIDPVTNKTYKPDEIPQGVYVAKLLGGLGQDDKEDPVLIWGGGTTLNPADANAKIYSVTASKEGVIAMTKKPQTAETQIVINSDGSYKGTSLTVNGNPIVFEDLSLYCGDSYSDDDEGYLHMSFTKIKTEQDGFKSTERFEFDADKASFIEEGTTMSDIMEQAKNVLIAKGYSTPEQVVEKVEAAKTEAGEQYKEYLSPDDHKAQVQVALDAQKATHDEETNTLKTSFADKLKVINDRIAEVEKAGFEMNKERSEKIVSFEADEAGKTAFTEYLESLKASQQGMLDVLKEKKIKIENAEKHIAKYDGKDDPRFQVFIETLSMVPTKANKDGEAVISFVLPAQGSSAEPDKKVFH